MPLCEGQPIVVPLYEGQPIAVPPVCTRKVKPCSCMLLAWLCCVAYEGVRCCVQSYVVNSRVCGTAVCEVSAVQVCIAWPLHVAEKSINVVQVRSPAGGPYFRSPSYPVFLVGGPVCVGGRWAIQRPLPDFLSRQNLCGVRRGVDAGGRPVCCCTKTGAQFCKPNMTREGRKERSTQARRKKKRGQNAPFTI